MTDLRSLSILAAGDSKAARVLVTLVEARMHLTITKLGQLGISGPRIWICYKEICAGNLEILERLVLKDQKTLLQRLEDLGYGLET